jgi:hypothetical protein
MTQQEFQRRVSQWESSIYTAENWTMQGHTREPMKAASETYKKKGSGVSNASNERQAAKSVTRRYFRDELV